LIDWAMDAAAIEWRVRGFQPWPGAFTQFRGQRLVVWGASVVALDAPRKPGEIVAARGDELIVACGGRTALWLREVQAEGRRRMSARDFVNGTRVQAGEAVG
jgi:methionyl-tRNA formyltransferase